MGEQKGSSKLAREVHAGHGYNKAMGFTFRCRLESRTRKIWFGFGPKVMEHRYVLERYYFKAWTDEDYGPWVSLPTAHSQAMKLLDEIEFDPTDDPRNFYV